MVPSSPKPVKNRHDAQSPTQEGFGECQHRGLIYTSLSDVQRIPYTGIDAVWGGSEDEPRKLLG